MNDWRQNEMDNHFAIDEKAEKLFKEMTGLDLYNHTHEEYQNWYHQQLIKEAEIDSYTKEILRSAENIIEGEDYSQIFAILKNYDLLVKQHMNRSEEMDLPFWCYCLFGLNEKQGA